jgi:hypothetical protein
MRKTICAIVIVLLSGSGQFLFPERLASLPDVMKPDSFAVDNDQLYIVEGTTIHLYSMKDFKRIKQFGNKGEGPGEFKYSPQIRVFPDYLLCNIFGKFMYFSRNGEYQKERKTSALRVYLILPAGENLVGKKTNFDRQTRKQTSQITVFNKDLETVKELATEERKRRGSMSGKFQFHGVRDLFSFDVDGKNIFVADTRKGFFFEVFDSNGNKLYQIKKEYKVLKVTPEYKKEFMERMSRETVFKQFNDRFEIIFRENFPAFRNFKIDNGKLLVFTYKKEDNQREAIVMDLKGKVLKTVFIPDEEIYAVNNGFFYYLKENEDEEEWELFAEKLF